MQSTDRIEFVRVLNGLAAIKRVQLTPEALDLWWSAMEKWTLEDFKLAGSHLVSSCQWMPNPYDFEQLRKAGEPTASEAWGMALEGCKNWRNPGALPNGRIARAARAIGGFKAIAFADIERELPHVQRRFLDAYAELTDVESVREELPQLTNSKIDFAQLLGPHE